MSEAGAAGRYCPRLLPLFHIFPSLPDTIKKRLAAKGTFLYPRSAEINLSRPHNFRHARLAPRNAAERPCFAKKTPANIPRSCRQTDTLRPDIAKAGGLIRLKGEECDRKHKKKTPPLPLGKKPRFCMPVRPKNCLISRFLPRKAGNRHDLPPLREKNLTFRSRYGIVTLLCKTENRRLR